MEGRILFDFGSNGGLLKCVKLLEKECDLRFNGLYEELKDDRGQSSVLACPQGGCLGRMQVRGNGHPKVYLLYDHTCALDTRDKNLLFENLVATAREMIQEARVIGDRALYAVIVPSQLPIVLYADPGNKVSSVRDQISFVFKKLEGRRYSLVNMRGTSVNENAKLGTLEGDDRIFIVQFA